VPVSSITHIPLGNRILDSLPDLEYERLAPHLEMVNMAPGKVICEATDTMRHAYFPIGGMVSLLSTTVDGETVEVAMVGSEGMVGIPIVLRANISPYRIMVQLPTSAMKVRADVFLKECRQGGEIQEQALKFTHTVLTQIAQSAVCNRFHSLEERLCRWLLIARDRLKSDNINLTHEFIAHMLGTPRTGVTMAANNLRNAGLIRYGRGRITILNSIRLEAASCECYQIVRDEISHFLAA
jgi:CRP-like cAMP-binding protein